jgi:hypothetical protein
LNDTIHPRIRSSLIKNPCCVSIILLFIIELQFRRILWCQEGCQLLLYNKKLARLNIRVVCQSTRYLRGTSFCILSDRNGLEWIYEILRFRPKSIILKFNLALIEKLHNVDIKKTDWRWNTLYITLLLFTQLSFYFFRTVLWLLPWNGGYVYCRMGCDTTTSF